MQHILFHIADHPLTISEAIVFLLTTGVIALIILVIISLRSTARQAHLEQTKRLQAHELESHIRDMKHVQSEMTGRMQTMAEVFGSRQSDLTRALSERIDGMSHRLGQSMTSSNRDTHENLRKLQERLAIIDRAQQTITELSQDVVGLQEILSNKQTRGAFGQGRMEMIIADALPQPSYSFQKKLTNNLQPDCLIHMPGDVPDLVIDAKFPLEAWAAMRESETAESEKQAASRFRQDMSRHISDIRERYFIPGETQDTAFMFVPSESIFADLHDHFENVVQKAYRSRIIFVSPSLLVLAIQVVQAVLRDARLREQAHIIRDEVSHLMGDVDRLDDRMRKLQTHFAQTTKDMEQILITTDKISKRGRRIEALEFNETHHSEEADEDKNR